jgi:hypothetical protein
MLDDKAKDATAVENAPRMTRDEAPAAALAEVATVATATPRGANKGRGGKSAAKKPTARKAAKKSAPRSAARAAKSRSKSAATKSRTAKAASKSPARSKSSPAVASAPKGAVRPAVAKAAVAKPAAAPTARNGADGRKALPAQAAQAASTALQAALRGAMPSGGVIPTAEAAFAPLSATLESGAEQARNAIGRARETRESLQQAVAHSATAAAKGMLEVNGKVLDLLRAQSDAAFELWRSTLTAGSLSEAVRVQTSGIRQAYEATTSHAKDVAEAATRAIGDAVKPLQSAMAPASR